MAYQMWSEEDVEVLKGVYGKLSIEEIGLLLKRKPSSVKAYAQKHKIVSARQWKPAELNFLRENFLGGNLAEISKELGRSIQAIQHIGSQMGLKRGHRTGTINDYAFSKLTPEACYWAGFIAADGCITESRKTLTIGLASKDKAHLLRLHTFLGLSTGFYDSTLARNKVSLHATSAQILSDLDKLFAIGPRKSLTYTPQDLGNEVMEKCFLVGMVDGDGCIKLNSARAGHNPIWSMGICGSSGVCNWFKVRLDSWYPNLRTKPAEVCQELSNGFSRFRISGVRAELAVSCLSRLPIPMLGRKWAQ